MYMWMYGMAKSCHALNAESCASEQATRTRSEYGGMGTACFSRAMFIADDRELIAASMAQRWRKHHGREKAQDSH